VCALRDLGGARREHRRRRIHSGALPLSYPPTEVGRAGVEPATSRSQRSSPRLRNATRLQIRCSMAPSSSFCGKRREWRTGSPRLGKARGGPLLAGGRRPRALDLYLGISTLAGWPRWGGVLGACLPIPRTCELCRACTPALCMSIGLRSPVGAGSPRASRRSSGRLHGQRHRPGPVRSCSSCARRRGAGRSVVMCSPSRRGGGIGTGGERAVRARVSENRTSHLREEVARVERATRVAT